MITDTYSAANGWGTADDIISDEFDSLDQELKKARFEAFEQLGPEVGRRIDIYQRYETRDFLAVINTDSSWLPIYCPDLASCMGLLAQLDPWYRMTQIGAFHKMASELYFLLTEYGEHGPLANCLGSRERQRERLRARAQELAERKHAKAKREEHG